MNFLKFSLLSLSLIASLMIVHYGLLFSAGFIILIVFAILMRSIPEFVTLAAFCVIYSNTPAIVSIFHGVPQVVAGLAPLAFLCLPVLSYVLFHKNRLIIDQTFLLMLAFLAAILSSSLFAKDMHIATGWVITFVAEGLVPYFLIINAVRHLTTLRRVIVVLMLTCSLLGTLSLYQEVTQSYKNPFAGFAQRNIEYLLESESKMGPKMAGILQPRDQVRVANRAGGPLGGPNRYAQIMIVILPLAFFWFWGEHSRLGRLGSAVAALLIVSGVLLSYSRGAFLTLVVLVFALTVLRYIRPYQVVLSMAMLLLVMVIAAPGYFARMDTIRSVQSLFSEEYEGEEPDGAIRGRATEMLAALQVFLDHPLLGVGPGQYTPFYSIDYQLSNDSAFKYLPRTRRAHILYFEMAAETGIIGITLFMGIVLSVMYDLWQERRRWMYSRPDLANIYTGLFLAFVAYLSTAVFLHFAYQRYYWLLLALAGAALQISRSSVPPTYALPPVIHERVPPPTSRRHTSLAH